MSDGTAPSPEESARTKQRYTRSLKMTHEILEQCEYMIKMKEEYFQQLEELVADKLKEIFPEMIFYFSRLRNRLVWWESITVINFWGKYEAKDIESIFLGSGLKIRAHKTVSGV